MSASRLRWLSCDKATAQHLHETLHIAPLLCRLLAQRGIRSFDDARRFFRPALGDLHDPFLLRDMERAVERLQRALQHGERILLYGDYDVDGSTSVALMFAFLSGLQANLDYYLPDREKEGYGVSMAGVEYARDSGASLVVAMDCGVKAHEAIAQAHRFGIDFIVCDHHLPDAQLPGAVAVLDPKQPGCRYPYKDLSGCGVAFKLAQALTVRRGGTPDDLAPLFDLVAVSIACDVVPMTGENRVLTHFGMEIINREPRVGLWALIQRSGRRYPLSISDVVFGLGPMINAAGRLGDAREAVRLLLSADRNSALEAAGALATRNRQRREADQSTTAAARRRVEEDPQQAGRKSIVLFDPEWHKGIIGITASRIAEYFHRPAVMLTQSGGKAVGSARSVPGFDLHLALSRCSELFSSFGGHAYAAGIQLPLENVPVFAEQFERVVQETMPPEAEIREIEIAGRLDFADISPAFWRTLRQFAPFGPGNMTPIFVASDVEDTGQSRMLANNHVRFCVRQGGGPVFSGIGFGLGQQFLAVKGKPFDLVFSLMEDTWQGERMLSLQVRDIRDYAQPCV
ncbi:MAG: single-stranded-DNA-specific exonuclease RecJ [Saprospirales bacterium]|nr:single-stranded-DNA-specific exonuclease RecJ [Saprospirales bacterium]